jgi:hypothetical protein
VRSEGNMSLKNPVTTPGIDPGTVRLVAQRAFKEVVFKINKNCVLYEAGNEVSLQFQLI